MRWFLWLTIGTMVIPPWVWLLMTFLIIKGVKVYITCDYNYNNYKLKRANVDIKQGLIGKKVYIEEDDGARSYIVIENYPKCEIDCIEGCEVIIDGKDACIIGGNAVMKYETPDYKITFLDGKVHSVE